MVSWLAGHHGIWSRKQAWVAAALLVVLFLGLENSSIIETFLVVRDQLNNNRTAAAALTYFLRLLPAG